MLDRLCDLVWFEIPTNVNDNDGKEYKVSECLKKRTKNKESRGILEKTSKTLFQRNLLTMGKVGFSQLERGTDYKLHKIDANRSPRKKTTRNSERSVPHPSATTVDSSTAPALDTYMEICEN